MELGLLCRLASLHRRSYGGGVDWEGVVGGVVTTAPFGCEWREPVVGALVSVLFWVWAYVGISLLVRCGERVVLTL